MPYILLNPETKQIQKVETVNVDTVYVKDVLFQFHGHLGQESSVTIRLDKGYMDGQTFVPASEEKVIVSGLDMLQLMNMVSPDNRMYQIYSFLTGSGMLPSSGSIQS